MRRVGFWISMVILGTACVSKPRPSAETPRTPSAENLAVLKNSYVCNLVKEHGYAIGSDAPFFSGRMFFPNGRVMEIVRVISPECNFVTLRLKSLPGSILDDAEVRRTFDFHVSFSTLNDATTALRPGDVIDLQLESSRGAILTVPTQSVVRRSSSAQ